MATLAMPTRRSAQSKKYWRKKRKSFRKAPRVSGVFFLFFQPLEKHPDDPVILSKNLKPKFFDGLNWEGDESEAVDADGGGFFELTYKSINLFAFQSWLHGE